MDEELIIAARTQLKDDGFGKSTKKLSNNPKIPTDDPQIVGNALARHPDFLEVGKRRGRKVYMLRSEMSEKMIEVWTE